jgi:hypothetical protein
MISRGQTAREMIFKCPLKSISLLMIAFLVGCTNSTPQLPAPQKIGHKERSRVISGKQAARVVNKMHSQSVAADANAIVEYGKEKKDILYISYYEDQNQAGKAFDLMIDKMVSAQKGPFFHLMPLPTYKNKVYFTLGMGARHYIFVSGNYLLWLQTFQSFGGELPPQLLNLYPLALESAGGLIDLAVSDRLHSA